MQHDLAHNELLPLSHRNAAAVAGRPARTLAAISLAAANPGAARRAGAHYLACQPLPLPGLSEQDRPLFLLEQARADLATSVLKFGAVRTIHWPGQMFRFCGSCLRLWLVLKAVEAIGHGPTDTKPQTI
jgi:hypothetical protein